ncbi:hypothetical protein F5Y14DRAFT_6405 [Nemania sp. NC0429]|nr:hypothetical protein F5Y14DRAFT_6405 [Nemania sp. NC0429]
MQCIGHPLNMISLFTYLISSILSGPCHLHDAQASFCGFNRRCTHTMPTDICGFRHSLWAPTGAHSTSEGWCKHTTPV